MEATSTTTNFETKSTDGLFELVHRAAKAVASDALDSGGMLEISEVEGGRGAAQLSVAAAFADDGLRRTIALLDVNVQVELPAPEGRVIALIVSRFGGTKYTNLCFATPVVADGDEDDLDLLRPRLAPDDALDVTIDCSGGVPFYAHNVALAADELSPVELEAATQSLQQLGVGFSRVGKTLRISKHQVRGPMRAESQAAAFVTCAQRDLTVSLYSATIPTTQSVRLGWRVRDPESGEKRHSLEVCFSRGLAGIEGTTKEQVTAIDMFIQEHFALKVGESRWVARSRKWSAGSETESRNQAAR